MTNFVDLYPGRHHGCFTAPSGRFHQFDKPPVRPGLPVGYFRSKSAISSAQLYSVSIFTLVLVLGLCKKISTASPRLLRGAFVEPRYRPSPFITFEFAETSSITRQTKVLFERLAERLLRRIPLAHIIAAASRRLPASEKSAARTGPLGVAEKRHERNPETISTSSHPSCYEIKMMSKRFYCLVLRAQQRI